MNVTFFLPGEPDLDALGALKPSAHPEAFRRGDRVWILQTYHHLRAAGRPVRLSGAVPDEGIVVFHAKHDKALLRRRLWMRRGFLLGVRADNREPLIADAEVLQNGTFADGRTRFHVPHWIQPGLIPRDPARGVRVARAAFKGMLRNLHPGLAAPEWEGFLRSRGIEWSCDVDGSGRIAREDAAIHWHDYSAVDLVVALRPPDRTLHRSKPASKLVNAWAAGVPAILGPESAYRELRRSELDYLECATMEEVRAAVRRLLDDGGLFHAMVENGRDRAAGFTDAAVCERWEEVLFDRLPDLERLGGFRRARCLPLPIKSAVNRVVRLATLRPAR